MIRIIIPLFMILAFLSCTEIPEQAETISVKPEIDPSYSGIIIPCNIAPLNFKINNPGSAFIVHIYGSNGKDILINSKDGNIEIPFKKWKELIANNINGEIHYDVYIKDKSKWYKYETINNTISKDSIDSYIAYRKIGYGYLLYNDMALYQRCIENYQETPIMTNDFAVDNCMNCHTFNKNDPSQMVFHIRGKEGGTVVISKDKKEFLNTATKYTMSAAVYASWHPSGKYVTFSVNKPFQFFPAEMEQNIVVEDKASDIILLDIETNTVTTSPKISTKSLENLPTWSPDGKYLYYISAEKTDSFETIKYDLLRIPFNVTTNEWGNAETMLTANETGKSITYPRVSPDNKYVMFCMIDNGYLAIHERESDIYIMNLENKKYYKLPVNSDFVESYPSWSSNGRWILFVSKRTDDLYSSSWFSHFDENGNAGKPFILPQKQADFYKSNLKNFNRPVFIKGKVEHTSKEIYKLTSKKAEPVKFDKNVDIDALSGATRISIPDSGKSSLEKYID